MSIIEVQLDEKTIRFINEVCEYSDYDSPSDYIADVIRNQIDAAEQIFRQQLTQKMTLPKNVIPMQRG